MILLVMKEDCCRAVAIIFFLTGDGQHQRVSNILKRAFQLLVFNRKLQIILVVITLVSRIHVKFMRNTWALILYLNRAMHVLLLAAVDDILELTFLQILLTLVHLSFLLGHFDILQRTLTIKLSKVSIFGSLIRICNI